MYLIRVDYRIDKQVFRQVFDTDKQKGRLIMTRQDYITLRNHLQALACTVDVDSKEYANLVQRIHLAHEKAYQNK